MLQKVRESEKSYTPAHCGYVLPHVPTPAEIKQARLKLGHIIQNIAQQEHCPSSADFGKYVASLTTPPRPDTPFSARLVHDWYTGTVMPSANTMLAIDALYEGTEELIDIYDTAAYNPQRTQRLFCFSLLNDLNSRSSRHYKMPELATQLSSALLSTSYALQMLYGPKPCDERFIRAVETFLPTCGYSPQDIHEIAETFTKLRVLQSDRKLHFYRSEISQAMEHAIEDLKLTRKEIPQALANHGYGKTIAGQDSLQPYHESNIHYFLTGKSQTVPIAMLRALDNILHEHNLSPEVSLASLMDTQLRETAENMWHEAVDANNLGGLLKACRLRMGIASPDAMGELLAPLLGRNSISPSTVERWEQNKALPCCGYANDLTPVFHAYCSLTKAWEKHPDSPSCAALTVNAPPWFGNDKHETLKQAFYQTACQAKAAGHPSEQQFRPNSIGFSVNSSTSLGGISKAIAACKLPTHENATGYQTFNKTWVVRSSQTLTNSPHTR